MVSFARKATNIASDLQKNVSSNAGWMRGIKAGKDLRVRFLQDPPEWLEFREHYARSTGFFPCTGTDGDCGGCASDDEALAKSSVRYVAQVLIQHEDGAKDIGEVRALKIPRTLANRLVARAERNAGTLLNRDYTILRTGNGLDTEYDVETEDKIPMDLSRYQFVDVESILEQMHRENAPQTFGRFGDEQKPAEVIKLQQKVDKATIAEEPLPDEEPIPF